MLLDYSQFQHLLDQQFTRCLLHKQPDREVVSNVHSTISSVHQIYAHVILCRILRV
jgi:hypothetical protein